MPVNQFRRASVIAASSRECRAEVAEGMGFEPTIRFYPYNGLANRRLQPLGHPSTDEWVTAHAAEHLAFRLMAVNRLSANDEQTHWRTAPGRMTPTPAIGHPLLVRRRSWACRRVLPGLDAERTSLVFSRN